MKVLITGANGLLGVNLVHELVEKNFEVKAFVRSTSDMRSLHKVSCQVVFGEISRYDDIHNALRDCDAIIHAASTTNILPLDFEYYRKINVVPTENIVQAVLRQGNKRLVYVSTASTFAPGSKENPGSESSPFTLGKHQSGYINSKFMAQQHVLENVEKNKLNAVVVNPTFMIGAYDAKPSSGKIILHALRRGIQWCPAGGKNFVHVSDVALGIELAMRKGVNGECYLLAGENLTYHEFFSKLNQVIGRKPFQIKIPKGIIHTAGSIANAWCSLTTQKLAFNKTNAHLLTLDNYYSGDKARRKFEFSTTPIEDAIREALDWFKKQNYISSDNYSTHGTNFDL